MRGVYASFLGLDKCQKQGCGKPTIYRIYKPGEVNRFFCGNHARKYFDRNAGAIFAAKLTGTLKLPYRVQVLDEAVDKLTKQEKGRIAENRGDIIWFKANGKIVNENAYYWWEEFINYGKG